MFRDIARNRYAHDWSDRLMDVKLVSENFISKPLEDLINLKIDALSLVQHVRTKNSPLHSFLAKMIVKSFSEGPLT